jgi:histidyl-tRNA synthetase
MPTQFDPPSGTRDFLAAEVEARERAFAVIRSVFSRYGFEPLQTPAFERLDVLLGKYGEEGDKLIFKILRRGEHEASGEADLALRYDMTVPLARVASAYGSQLPTPYKRYAMGPVWRADRPGRGRFREFVQCDLDTLGTTSVLADAEVICAVHDTLAELGVPDFRFLLNSRHVLAGLLEASACPANLGPGRADHPGQAGQDVGCGRDRRADRAGPGQRHRRGPGRRDDRPGCGGADPVRAQAQRGGLGRAGRGG